MQAHTLSRLKEEEFLRLTGVRRETFEPMMQILRSAEAEKYKAGGRPCKLALAERLLMTLEYLREYRTYFHIAQSRGVEESTAYNNIVWIENTLIRDGTFSLPGKKALLSGRSYEVVLIDGTESPIQRPKKSSENTILVRRNATR